eukprot:6104848-Prorocentrum_lima.AAC.1
MTSSLVGSEMCIRDSLRNPLVLSMRRERGGFALTCFSNKVYSPGSFATVSYTHLTLPTICSV